MLPVAKPVKALDPPPDPSAHQRYADFPPKKLYELHQEEFRWPYHCDAPYTNLGGTPSWGWSVPGVVAKNACGKLTNKFTPGATIRAHYGDPVLVRQVNDLPPVGTTDQGRLTKPSQETPAAAGGGAR